MKVSRGTPEGAAYHDLRNMARRENRLVEELFAFHVLDGFLARLAVSGERDRFVLKGGVLLAAFALRRPTRDVDLMAEDLDNDVGNVLSVVRSVTQIPYNDGVSFDTSGATAEVIRDEEDYPGVRVSMVAAVATARVSFHVDVNVGDPISPAPREISLPRVLGAPIELRGYPLEMVHAEKVVTAVSRGTVNTRWRDFGDVYALAGRHAVDGDQLTASLRSVAARRQVDLLPLNEVLDGYADIAQSRYATWRRKQNREDLPEQFLLILDRVVAFADPALAGLPSGTTWSPEQLAWVPLASHSS